VTGPDIVYVVRPGDDNEELRYSIRSLRFLPHGQVWIVGHKPSWLDNVRHIPTDQTATKYLNATGNIRTACEHPDMPDQFVWCNDDFFAMQPATHLPIWHQGPITKVIRRFSKRPGPYLAGMKATLALLQDLGISEPLSYDLHLPMLVDRDRLLDAIELRETVDLAHTRSLYGNLYGIGGTQVEDVKVYTRDATGWTWYPWLSTTDTSFRDYPVGAHIRATHPAASQYEAETAASVAA
jgi:hypothetical protein